MRLLGFATCARPLSEQRTETLALLQRSRLAGAPAHASSVQGLGFTVGEKLCACMLPARLQSSPFTKHKSGGKETH